jgi:hypothetical protein
MAPHYPTPEPDLFWYAALWAVIIVLLSGCTTIQPIKEVIRFQKSPPEIYLIVPTEPPMPELKPSPAESWT